MSLPVTSLFAALAALMLIALSIPVSLRRIKLGASLGDAGDDILLRRIRAQGNFAEYAPVGLILLALNELAGADPAVVWTIGGVLLLGRLSHAAGLRAARQPLVIGGMVLTYTSLAIGAFSLLARLA